MHFSSLCRLVLRRSVAAALVVAFLAGPASAQQPIDPAKVMAPLGFPYAKTLPYRLFKPANLAPGKTYPLIVFLHGAGERGTDNAAQVKQAVPDILANADKHPFFLVAPQCPQGLRWVEVSWSLDSHVMPEQPSEPLAATMDLLDKLCKEQPIDKKRIYVVGLSMGGFGVWDAISRYPGKFAAAVPVCGGGDVAQAPKLVHTPIWAFHGDKDTTVKTQRSRDMVEAIKQAGGEAKYTEYPGVAHGSWGQAFKTPELYDWLFAQALQ